MVLCRSRANENCFHRERKDWSGDRGGGWVGVVVAVGTNWIGNRINSYLVV